MQRRGMRAGLDAATAGGQHQRLLAGTPGRSLGHTHDSNAVDTELIEYPAGLRDLPLAAVDQENVRALPFTFGHLAETAHQRRMHGCVIVARCNTFDVEAPVV